MAVLRDANATAPVHFASVGTVSLNTLTVGANVNTVLIAQLTLQFGSILTITQFQWDAGGTNQNMTLIGSATDANLTNTAYLYGLVNPTPGNKTLTVAWSGGGVGGGLNATSYFNADTSSNVANAFHNFNSASGTGTSATLSVSSLAGEIVVDCAECVNILSNGGTQTTLAIDNSGSTSIASGEQLGAASVTSTWAISGGAQAWVDVGCSIKAVGVAVTFPVGNILNVCQV